MPLTQPHPGLDEEAYRRLQVDRSVSLKDHDPGERARYLIGRMKRFAPPSGRPGVLCVGCRNRHELDYLEAEGYSGVVGIDLHSTDPRILVMDMHRMAFEDDAFDVVYASHSLEHSLDPSLAAAEFLRVVRLGGWIVVEVPVRYGRRGADLWDFESEQGVLELFSGCDAVWSETGPQIGAEKQQASRLILKVCLK